MKKISAIIAAALAAAMLAGCGGTGNSQSLSSAESMTASAQESQTETAQTTTVSTEAQGEIPADTTTSQTESSTASAEVSTTSQSTSATQTATTAQTTAAITTTAAPQTTTAQEPEIKEEEPVEAMYIALTFDDGPNTTTTMQVLDVLEKHGVVASFFLIGDNIDDNSAQSVKRAHDMGCEINNHSKTHSNMTELSADEIIAEFNYTDDKIFEITGERSKFFRPPYISVNDEMLDSIDVPFIAGIGCNDWEDRVTAEMRTASILKQVKDGSIILMHDMLGNDKTVEALDTLIPQLKERGYTFVTVSQLFNIKGIEISGEDIKIYTNVLQSGQWG